MGSKRFYEHAQNLLGVKRKCAIIELGGQKGCYYNYTKLKYVVLIVLYYNNKLYYYHILYIIMILLYCYIILQLLLFY